MISRQIKAIFLIVLSLFCGANAMEEMRNVYTNQEEAEIEILSDLELVVDPSAKFFNDEEEISGCRLISENEEFESFVCNSDDEILCSSDREMDNHDCNHSATDGLSDVDLLMHLAGYKNLRTLALLASKNLLRTGQANHALVTQEKKCVKRSRSTKRRVNLPIKFSDYELENGQPRGDILSCDIPGCTKIYHWKTSLQRHQRIAHGKKLKTQ